MSIYEAPSITPIKKKKVETLATGCNNTAYNINVQINKD